MAEFDRDLRDLTGYQLKRANTATTPGVNKVLAQFGLRRSTYSSLAVIVSRPGLNQGQLADALAIERPNIVQIIDCLEGSKLVRRTKSDEDRRAYALQPTPQGRGLLDRATNALKNFDKWLTKGISKQDLEKLHWALEKIEENAEQMETRDVYDVSSS